MEPLVKPSCLALLASVAMISWSAGVWCTPSDSDHPRPDGARAAPVIARPATRSAADRSDKKSSFTVFESGQVRPLAISSDGRHLFAVNTPDNRLEIFRISGDRLTQTASIPVGLEPVAVALRNDHELWVVNHLSDSVSVVALRDDASGGHVERTLLVGDEPRDIVFAGPEQSRAFITIPHRAQNPPDDPMPTPPGVGRAGV